MGEETNNQENHCIHSKHWLGFIAVFVLSIIFASGVVYYLMNQQAKNEKSVLIAQIESERQMKEGCEMEKEELSKEIEANKKNDTANLTDIITWTLVSHENFWNNPELFKSGSHGFPDIKFSYPENWSFACCGDMSHASVHIIYSSKERDLALPYINITDFVLKGCPDSQEVCAIDKQIDLTATEKFNQIKSGIATENVLPKFKLEKLNVDAFVFEKQEKDNSYSKAYLINTGDDVIEIDFVNYDLLDNSFMEEFLSKISYE